MYPQQHSREGEVIIDSWYPLEAQVLLYGSRVDSKMRGS